MSTVPPIVAAPPLTVSPEVYEYTRKHGIEEPLRRLLEATPRLYPMAASIKVFMEQDVEDSDLWFIVFEVHVPAADIPDYVAAQNLWGEEWLRAYPSPRNHSFVLSLRRRDGWLVLVEEVGGVLPCEGFLFQGDAAMSTVPALTTPPMTVSPEVYEYTQKHGIEEPLRRLLEVTPRIYPTAMSIKVYMEQDVDDGDLWFIVFEVHVAIADCPDYVAAQRPWGKAWMEAYPYPRNHHFVLSLERV